MWIATTRVFLDQMDSLTRAILGPWAVSTDFDPSQISSRWLWRVVGLGIRMCRGTGERVRWSSVSRERMVLLQDLDGQLGRSGGAARGCS